MSGSPDAPSGPRTIDLVLGKCFPYFSLGRRGEVSGSRDAPSGPRTIDQVLGKCFPLETVPPPPIRCLIATLADPVRTTSGYHFDEGLTAILRGIEARQYVLDRYRLPWQQDAAATQAEGSAGHLRPEARPAGAAHLPLRGRRPEGPAGAGRQGPPAAAGLPRARVADLGPRQGRAGREPQLGRGARRSPTSHRPGAARNQEPVQHPGPGLHRLPGVPRTCAPGLDRSKAAGRPAAPFRGGVRLGVRDRQPVPEEECGVGLGFPHVPDDGPPPARRRAGDVRIPRRRRGGGGRAADRPALRVEHRLWPGHGAAQGKGLLRDSLLPVPAERRADQGPLREAGRVGRGLAVLAAERAARPGLRQREVATRPHRPPDARVHDAPGRAGHRRDPDGHQPPGDPDRRDHRDRCARRDLPRGQDPPDDPRRPGLHDRERPRLHPPRADRRPPRDVRRLDLSPLCAEPVVELSLPG